MPWISCGVCGIPVIEYGDLIAEHIRGKAAIADDIAGWDTKVSMGLLRLQCELMQSPMDDQERKRDFAKLQGVVISSADDITTRGN